MRKHYGKIFSSPQSLLLCYNNYWDRWQSHQQSVVPKMWISKVFCCWWAQKLQWFGAAQCRMVFPAFREIQKSYFVFFFSFSQINVTKKSHFSPFFLSESHLSLPSGAAAWAHFSESLPFSQGAGGAGLWASLGCAAALESAQLVWTSRKLWQNLPCPTQSSSSFCSGSLLVGLQFLSDLFTAGMSLLVILPFISPGTGVCNFGSPGARAVSWQFCN